MSLFVCYAIRQMVFCVSKTNIGTYSTHCITHLLTTFDSLVYTRLYMNKIQRSIQFKIPPDVPQNIWWTIGPIQLRMYSTILVRVDANGFCKRFLWMDNRAAFCNYRMLAVYFIHESAQTTIIFTRLCSRRVVMFLVVVYVYSFVHSFPHTTAGI